MTCQIFLGAAFPATRIVVYMRIKKNEISHTIDSVIGSVVPSAWIAVQRKGCIQDGSRLDTRRDHMLVFRADFSQLVSFSRL
jgi:hypothetical protein